MKSDVIRWSKADRCNIIEVSIFEAMSEDNVDRQRAKRRRAITRSEKRARDRAGAKASLPAQDRDNVHGEGNYRASREFDEAERKFVQSGKLDEGIRNAAPKFDEEARQMEAAEEKARRRAKEEDPALLKKPPTGEQGRRG